MGKAHGKAVKEISDLKFEISEGRERRKVKTPIYEAGAGVNFESRAKGCGTPGRASSVGEEDGAGED